MDRQVFLRGGWVFGAPGLAAGAPGVVEIAGGRIGRVGPAQGFELPEGADLVEAEGCTVLPGLIDTHIHVFHEAQMLRLSEGAAALWGANYVQSALRAGVTTIRDLGCQTDAVFGLKRALAAGWAVGPRLQACGRAICMTAGHGWANLSVEADGPDAVRKAARQQIKAGADVIKVMATGGAGTPGELPTSVQLGVAEMRAAVEEAHNGGKPAAAHALATQGIKNAIEAGVDTVEHGVFLDDEAIEMLLRRNVALCPTISVYPRIVERGAAGGEAGFVIEKSRPLVAPHFDSIRRAVEAGVRIVFGTDSATLYNPLGDFDAEMALMRRAGMSAEAVLLSATRTAAEVCGIAGEVGTLETGKAADVLLVRGNALDDLGALQSVRAVWRDGVPVHAAGDYRSPGLVGRPVLGRDLRN